MKNTLFVLILGFLLVATACVKVNTDLGQNLALIEHRYQVFCESIPLQDVYSVRPDSTYAFNTYRIAVGAIRDPQFGLTTLSSAFVLVPLDSVLNFGHRPEIKELYLSLTKDTLSIPYGGNSEILQNLRVYALDEETDINDAGNFMYGGDAHKFRTHFASKPTITDYVPVYGGEDTLNIHFSNSKFTENLVEKLIGKATQNDRSEYVYKVDHADSLCNSNYLKDFPGIYITCDPPQGNGGRFNLFDLVLDLNTNTYVISGNYAELKFRSTYGGDTEPKDTSFLFMIGAGSVPKKATSLPLQEAFIGYEHDDLPATLDGMTPLPDGSGYKADTKLYIQGAAGLIPVVSAGEIRDSLLKRFERHKVTDRSKVIIDKASLYLSFKPMNDYGEMDNYPKILSPMHVSRYQIRDRKYGTTEMVAYTDFPPITDAGVSAEDQGDLDRSNLGYMPDISFHTQHLLKMNEPTEAALEKQDIWMFTKASEIIVTQTVSSADSDYYRRMMYYSYLNSMYGGYGNYGYGYNSYNSYYSMMYYNSMMNASTEGTTTSVQKLTDFTRFYKAVLCGPKEADELRRPQLVVTYSVPKDCLAAEE